MKYFIINMKIFNIKIFFIIKIIEFYLIEKNIFFFILKILKKNLILKFIILFIINLNLINILYILGLKKF